MDQRGVSQTCPVGAAQYLSRRRGSPPAPARPAAPHITGACVSRFGLTLILRVKVAKLHVAVQDCFKQVVWQRVLVANYTLLGFHTYVAIKTQAGQTLAIST